MTAVFSLHFTRNKNVMKNFSDMYYGSLFQGPTLLAANAVSILHVRAFMLLLILVAGN
jgi:hypothetical protein